MAARLAVLGAGGHGAVVISTARAAGFDIVGVFDDQERHHGGEVLGVPILGPIAEATGLGADGVIVAIGDNADRAIVAGRVSLVATRVVHPGANVAESSRIGDGAVVFAGATIQARTSIGKFAIVNTGALVDHDCRIGDFVHLAPGATVCGDVVIGEGAFVGAGATLTPGIEIGAHATVGAGAVVLDSVSAGATVAGVPARPVGDR